MANHYRVSPKYWLKARKRGWNDQETTLGLYLLTCDHRNLEGLYRLPKPYIAADLGWSQRKVDDTLTSVCAAGFAAYDEDAEMVLIPKALKHQSPSTDNQIKGAIAQLERIPRTALWDAFRMACASHCPKLADAIGERWPSDTPPVANGSSRARAGSPAPASSSSSSSSSNSSPPRPPAGGRERDILRYEGELAEFCAEHFPGAPADLIAHQASELRARKVEPTVEALRPFVERWHPTVEAPTT